MGRKLPYTPNSQIRSALRKLFLRSRERSSAIRRDGYTCVKCGAKQSKAKGKEIKVEVNHIDGIEWDVLFDEIRKRILVDPSRLETLCEKCHREEHEK